MAPEIDRMAAMRRGRQAGSKKETRVGEGPNFGGDVESSRHSLPNFLARKRRQKFALHQAFRVRAGTLVDLALSRKSPQEDAMADSTFRPKIWTPGDWNAFFGFGTNILVNMLTLTALLRFVLKMPDSLVFGRILPAVGLMLFLSTMYYAWLAYRLAKTSGRDDVCALPSGISVPHMFIVTFVIMLPITLKTGDPVKGWQAGLVWVFFQSFILMIGGFIAPFIRRVTPRAALLGTLAGVSVTFISMRPALDMFMTPVIGLTCFAIIMVSWFGGVKYPKGLPAGLVAIIVGMAIAWGSNLFGLNYGGLSLDGLTKAVSGFGFAVPLPAFDMVFSGFEFLGIILVTAIPFGIYDLVEAMDNVESAEAAGDAYPTTRVLTADGVVSLIGCLMGNPFINAVYIGHPGWKAMGGRIGYSAATGLMVIVLAWFGIIAVLLALVPVVAISPILLYIGMLIGAQAFQTTPSSHAPAIVLALTPHLAAWCKTLMDGALGAAGTNAAAVGFDKLISQGVLYQGLQVMGGGSILTGLILAAVGSLVIDRKFQSAAAFALAGAVLTFFGFMHGESIGIAVTPTVAVAYLIVAAFIYGLSRYPDMVEVPMPKAMPHAHAHPAE
jgi:adenine/guanine/hypoxanthine permease